MRYKLQDNYFQEINTAEKAYWLGFLYADGYVAKKAPWVTVCQIADIDHVKKLRSAIDFTGEVKVQQHTNGYKNSTMGRLTISRKKMCKDLASHGCESGKKETIKTNYQAAYWRGIFDGDGCISVSERYQTVNGKQYGPYTNATCYIILQKKDVQSFVNVLNAIGIKAQIANSTTEHMKYVRFSSLKDILKFSSWLYSEPGPHLERKKSKFDKIWSLQQATAVE